MVTGDTGTLSGLAPIIPSSNIGKKCSVIRQAEIDLYYCQALVQVQVRAPVPTGPQVE